MQWRISNFSVSKIYMQIIGFMFPKPNYRRSIVNIYNRIYTAHFANKSMYAMYDN